jgi:hypothetical protein
MQKKRFAAEQKGRGHIGNCLGLYATLVLFTSQMLTREARRGLRKFLESGMSGVHDPILFARYVIAPVNHLLYPQIADLKTKSCIAPDAVVGLKLFWLARQILFKRMLTILDSYGWEPKCVYKSNDEELCMEWVVSKQSPWGCKFETGIIGVTQIVFQSYGLRMQKATLFASLRGGESKLIDGKGIFKADEYLKRFIADDFGLNAQNNLPKIMHSVINGKEALGNETILTAWRGSPRKKRARRKDPPSKATASKAEGPGAAGVRKSKRTTNEKGFYMEEKPEEEEKEEEIATSQPKKPKICPSCTSLATAVKELQNASDQFTHTKIIKEMEKLLKEHIPGMEDVLLLVDEDDPAMETEKDMGNNEHHDGND